MFERRTNSSGSPFNSITGLIFGVLFLVAIFFVARFVFQILYYLSPFMLIAALIIDHKVVTGYVQWIVKLFKQNVLMGIGATVVTALVFPIVTAFLLGNALFKKKIKNVEQRARNEREGQLVDYEEVESEPLDLPELEKPKSAPKDDYDNLFE